MSEDATPTEPAPPRPPPSLRQALQATDPVSMGALVTAIVASLVGVVQTGFMWIARNDEVQAALRTQQLHACVAYRRAGVTVHARAQAIAQGLDDGEGGQVSFKESFDAYQDAIGELGYLLPQSDGPALDAAEEDAIAVYTAVVQEDQETLTTLSRSDGQWSAHNNAILEACDTIIRDVRDH